MIGNASLRGRSRNLRDLAHRAVNQRYLFLMLLPALVWLIVFVYMPIGGWLMAFQNYSPAKGLWGSPWVGLKHFKNFITDYQFWPILRNTVFISLLNILGGTVAAVVLALLLNEVRSTKFKRTVQTITYLPHFISYIVVGNIFMTILSPSGGVVNHLLMSLGWIDAPIFFFAQPKGFWFLLSGINIWKEAGWDAIIYLAAITAINSELYEAAEIDGAGRLRRMWHVTMPGIRSTIVVLLIMASGYVLNAGFEPSYVLGNPIVSDYAEVIDTYVYNMGLRNTMFSYATAVGMFRMAVSLVILLATNFFAKKVGERGIL